MVAGRKQKRLRRLVLGRQQITVVNAGSDSSRTRMRGAKNTASVRRRVNEMKAKKRQRGGGGTSGGGRI